MFSLSSAQHGSDPVLTFTTQLGTNPVTYCKLIKYLKWLLKQLGLGTDYSSHSFMRGGVFPAFPVR